MEKMTIVQEIPDISLISHFSVMKDPRLGPEHRLTDIIVIAVCAVICGADNWVDVEAYGHAKQDWLEGLLGLRNGIPSHDTFGRVFSAINPVEFQQCFLAWVSSIVKHTKGEVIGIDGKTSRRSFDRQSDQSALHMVSAWASGNALVLGQKKSTGKKNEIETIPELLKLLELNGCIVTIDAMGCQEKIATQIIKQEGDYVLGLKKNQKSLFETVELTFRHGFQTEFKYLDHTYYRTFEKNHGRLEEREYWLTSELDHLSEISGRTRWPGLNSIGMVRSRRTLDGKTTEQIRYFITSLQGDAKEFARAVRQHWAVENSLHWVLDIAFREDESRLRKDYGAENFAVLRHIAVNLAKQEKTAKCGVKGKRLKAGWDNDYLLKLFA